MLKLRATGKDGPLIMLGLSHENLRRLKAGQPIKFPLSTLDIPPKGDLVIFAGETEEAMIAELIEHGLVRPGTEIREP